MRLTSFRVRRYKNVLDSTEVSVEADVTTLVGMNESGKSAMLNALYRLNPVYEDTFSERDDYPRWRWKRDGRGEDLTKITPIEATFELRDDDLRLLADKLGEGVVSEQNVAVGRRYDQSLWIRLSVDEQRFIENVLRDHPEAKTLQAAHDTIASLEQALEDRLEASEETEDSQETAEDQLGLTLDADSETLAAIKSAISDSSDLNAAARQIVHSRLPRFFLFSEYQNLEGRVDIANLRSSEDEKPGASSKQTARALLKLADTDIDSVTDEEFESRTAELEAVASDISAEMSEYWSTNPELRIKIEPEYENIKDRQGTKSVVTWLNFRVEDRKHDFTNNFAFRSSGYQWFFSFLAAFSEFEDQTDVVMLLDEPALTLHAKAQRDFLRFISERLAPIGQVLYTTHSPFMVEQIERVRVVEDRGGKVGSVTSSDSLEVGEDSIFPLQAALGYDLSQNLFIGERNLLVEGPSDLVYLDLIGRHLRDQGREGIDERWRILPAGGASNVPTFVSLIGRKVSVSVLLDSGTEGLGKIQAALDANRIHSERLVFVGSVIDQQHSDIEDLFSTGDYLALYNEAFEASHKVNDLPNYPDRLVLKLEAVGGKFDHWRPAEVLLRNPAKIKRLSAATLTNFEKLSRAINATHGTSNGD